MSDHRSEMRIGQSGGDEGALQLWLALVEQVARSSRLESEVRALHASASWKLTAPLRRLSSFLRGPGATAALRSTLPAGAAGPSGALGIPVKDLPRPLHRWLDTIRTHSVGGARLLVDVTEVDLEDLGAGIQRVTKRLLTEFITSSELDVAVIPVRLGRDGTFCTAWRFAERLLGLPEGLLREEQAVVPGSTDCLLGLDLCQRHHAALAKALDEFRHAKARIALVVYDVLPLTNPDWFPDNIVADHRAWLPLVAKYADVALCISNHVRSELADAFRHLEVEFRGRMEVVAMGSDVLWSDVVRSTDPAVVRVLMVGTVEPRKGHADALDAMERLWGEGRKMQLIIAGRPGWHSNELQQRIRGHRQFGTRLFWHESIDDVGLARLYASADLLLMASYGEGYGLPIAEAARCGCDLLVRDLSVFREVAGDRARYFAPARLTSELATYVDRKEWPSPSPPTWPTWLDSANAITGILRGSLVDAPRTP